MSITPSNKDPVLTILIVSYNTEELTLECVRSVFRQTVVVPFEIIVVDNNSADRTVARLHAEFPSLAVIALDHNPGFAGANNLAAELAKGSCILLLNPDTVVLDGAIDRLMEYAEAHPEHDLFGGSQFYPDGRRNPESCWSRPTPWSLLLAGLGLSFLFPRSRFMNPESFKSWDWREPREVDIISGSFLLIRATLWRALRGFDPAFFMYGEDADLCLRARERGSSCVVVPQARIIHYGGASERAQAGKLVRLFAAKQRLFSRHWKPTRVRFGVAMLKLMTVSRYLFSAFASPVSNGSRLSCEVWGTVWRARSRWSAGDPTP